MNKRIAIFTDKFDSSNTSAGQHMTDLVFELSKYHELIIEVFTLKSSNSCMEKTTKYPENVFIHRVKVRGGRNSSLFFRLLNELSISFVVLSYILRVKKLRSFDNVIWYSPTIFWGPLIRILKFFNKTKNILILRDIFPQWAVDLEIIKKYSIEYCFLRFFELLQYSAADVIAIQSDGNSRFFEKSKNFNKLITLKTWYDVVENFNSIQNANIKNIPFNNKKVCIYAGNLGLAQNQNLILNIVNNLDDGQHHFLFIGQKKTDRISIEQLSQSLNIKNLTVINAIPVKELNSIFPKCHLGIFSLDARHTTHNIPGKFLHYISVGLPVFGLSNKNNDINRLIKNNNLGSTYSGNDAKQAATEFIDLSIKISKGVYKKESIQSYVKNELCPKKTTSKILKLLE